MGGRGSSSGTNKHDGRPSGAAGLIRGEDKLRQRANDSSALGNAGDIIYRAHRHNVEEIRAMGFLTEAEKSDALRAEAALARRAYEVTGRNVSWSRIGPARVNSKSQAIGADEIARANAAHSSHIKGVRKLNEAGRQRVQAHDRRSAVQAAIASGSLSFTFEGKTYARKSRRSKSFTLQM